ncbi:hypothetical protein CEP54_014555 [Fusarium duplospermum]|uniref:Major facilitator superfamily (MFS) profile domain-containing protein n=1 Tax=Fusarium duplospermum TaxID=1325734 RepID=A0A428NVD9_9HYPO|nr:hypothetical protein CEP54_014555 [Fusarium duplospermum]
MDTIDIPRGDLQGNVDAKRWWKYRNLRNLNLLLIIPFLSLFTIGFDGSMMNGLQSIETWRKDFGEPTGATLGLFNAAYPIGGFAAVPFVSVANDRFGRRVGSAFGALVCVIGAVVQAAAFDMATFVVARGILGAGTVLLAASGGSWITEVAHPSHRSTATALFQTGYSLGSIVAAWTTFGTFRINSSAGWRIPSALQGAPALFQFIGFWFVPESPRWLVSKDRNEEALATLAKYHAEGDTSDPIIQFEYNEIQQALSFEKDINTGNFIQNYGEFLRTPGNRKRLFIIVWAAMMTQMSGNAFVSYYLSPILMSVGLTSSLKQTLINATASMFAWVSTLYFATLPDRLGRRTLFLASGACIFICLVAITTGSAVYAQNSSKVAGGVVVAFIYLFSPAYNLGLNGNFGLYTTEILPFHLRMRGQAINQFFQTAFVLLAVYAIPVGLEKMGWKFYTIFIPWVVVEFVVVFFTFPETKGPSLEEIAIIFDGENALGPRDVKKIELERGVGGVEHAEQGR